VVKEERARLATLRFAQYNYDVIHNVDAIYDHGVFRPAKPLALQDGALVHLRVEEQKGNMASVAASNHRVSALLSALDHGHNTEPIGPLKREELYDRDNLR
jgi:predicted DNA-binding antitoxin AbrB/MazE fold protein